MSVPPRMEEQFRVRSYEIEPDGQLRIVALARMLQEVAWLHASMLGKGFAERESGALFWVLSRLRVHVGRLPRWGDTFTIRTWPVGTDRLLAVRDFLMFDGEGVMGRMTSGWLVVDGSSGRPVRPEALVADLPLSPSEFDGDIERLRPPSEMTAVAADTVRYHDIDQYRHVNNAAYLEWIIDALAARDATRARSSAADPSAVIRRIDGFSVDYLKELVLGDGYRTALAETDEQMWCEVSRATDGEHVCRARLHFKEV